MSELREKVEKIVKNDISVLVVVDGKQNQSRIDWNVDTAIDSLMALIDEEVKKERDDVSKISDGYHTFNELYEHRHTLFALACKNYNGWKSKLHSDGTMFEGWFIAGIDTPNGQAAYHLPMAWWDRYDCKELERAPEWDGHTPEQARQRLETLSQQGE